MYHGQPVLDYYRQQIYGEQRNTIKVFGDGTITAAPDQVTVTVGVISEGQDLTVVQRNNADTSMKIINILHSYNISNKNIQTYDYQVNTEYDYQDGKQLFRGYRVQNILKVIIEDISSIGAIINSVIQSGANYVSNITFGVKNSNQYYIQALKLALEFAHKKAQAISTDLKVNWNPIPIRVEEYKQTAPIIEHQLTYVKGATTDQFQPGTLQFTASLLAIYQYS